MFLFLLVLMIFLVFIDFIFFELLLNLVDLLVEESPDIRLLLNQNLGSLVLNRVNVVLDLLVELVDLLHSISIRVVQTALRSTSTNTYFISY